MKRKIFSKLLMVALVIAAVGSFVSCKDYDDDINNLQKQIDAKAAISELTALQSTLDSKIAAAQSAAAAAQATADAAATKTAVADLKTALEAAIADAKKAGTDAGTQAGNAITAANKAQETADGAAAAAKKADEDAKAALADALKTIAETYETKADAAAKAAEAKTAIEAVKEAIAAVKATADAAFTKAEAEKLQEQVNNLKSELESAIDEKIDAKIQEVNNAVASVDAIWKAVTSVELYSQDAVAIDEIDPYEPVLDFRHATIAQSSVFGDEESWNPVAAAEKVEFAKDDSVAFINELLVRVNPANATFAKEDVKIVNSLGEALNPKYITIGDPVRFDDLLTRAGEVKNALWRIPVSLNKGITDKDLKSVLRKGNQQILFAVAINMTGDVDADRFVYSNYEIESEYGKYTPATTFGFKVNGDLIGTLKNRWDAANQVVIAEDGTKTSKHPELSWAANSTDHPTPAYSIVETPAKNKNYVTNLDGRLDGEYVKVDEGDEIVISAVGTLIANDKNIAYYYAALDSTNAVESNPSEYEAWEKYGITGLGEMKKASEKLSIGFPKGDGDIVGIRVYAVNYDGTLADPDGRAFYVQIGTPAGAGKATAATTWKAVAATSGLTAASTGAQILAAKNNVTAIVDLDGYDNFEYLTYDVAGQVTIDDGTKTGNVKVAYDDIDVNYVLLDSNGKTVNNWNKARKIKLVVDNSGSWLDKAAITFTIEGRDESTNNKLVNMVEVTLTKQMPDGETTGITWKSGADKIGNVLKLHMDGDNTVAEATIIGANDLSTMLPTAGGLALNTRATYGVATLSDYVTLSTDYAWNITFAGAHMDKDDVTAAYDEDDNPFVAYDYSIDQAAGTATSALDPVAVIASDVTVDAATDPAHWAYNTPRWHGVVGDETAYATVISRVYTGISCADYTDDNTYNPTADEDYKAKAEEFSTYFIDDMKQSQTWRSLEYQYMAGLTTANKNTWATCGLGLSYAGTALAPVKSSVAGVAEAGKVTAAPAVGDYYFTDADGKLMGGWPLVKNGGAKGPVAVANNLTTLLVGTNSWSAPNLAYFTANQYVTTGMISESKGVKGNTMATYNARFLKAEDYYNVTTASTGALGITKNATAPATIAQDFDATLVITGMTTFGNIVTIAEIPVTVLK